MGGLGKTTVAKKLFNCHAFVFVSEEYNMRKMLLGILEKVVHNADSLQEKGDNELKKALFNHLIGRKYIIFLDDVWKTEMWDDVRECFPDKSNGSRIVITTRIAEVARHASPNNPLFLRFLRPGESWQLFCKKVFRGERFPSHLEALGRQIVKRCNGLPLSIVVLGSMLSTKEKSERVWEGTVKYVSSFLNEQNTCIEILALSYRHLPAELKPCFLYFAAFPEDYEMSVRRLIGLWVAEGFIPAIGERPQEHVAESYLELLIDRSLIQTGTRRTDGGVKTCRIHDLLRDLCIREARRENFFAAHTNIASSSGTSLESASFHSKPRRVSVHCYTSRFILSKQWDPSSVRAFISFDLQGHSLSTTQWKSLGKGYKLLRILDLGETVSVTDRDVPEAITELINLRYLKFRSSEIGFSIPYYIFQLWNLQMLFIWGSAIYYFPSGFFQLQRLNQVVVHGRAQLYGFRSSTKVPSALRVLSSVHPDEPFISALVRGYFGNLIKLGLYNSQTNSITFKLNLLRHFPHLETLNLTYFNSTSKLDIPMEDIFEGFNESDLPPNLKKLTIKSAIWSVSSFQMLGNFPNLQILKLFDVSFKDTGDLYTLEASFPKLHTLHMHNLRGFKLQIHSRALLELRHLLVSRAAFTEFADCRRLWELPNLQDVQFMWPNDTHLREFDSRLQQVKSQSKCRLLVYSGH